MRRWALNRYHICNNVLFSGGNIMKKRNIFLVIMLSILCTFSYSFAYQSFWDQFGDKPEENNFISIKDGLVSTNKKNTISDAPLQKEPDISIINLQNNIDGVRNEGVLRIDSLKVFGNGDENTNSLIQALNGLEFDFSVQTGSIPMNSFSMRLAETPLFTYTGQLTSPYFVNSNFLGTQTYMITQEDQFEEKVVDSLYKMIEKMSGPNSNLPDKQSVYDVIRAFRENGISNSLSASMSMNISFEQNLDASAFEPIMMTLMTKITETDPTANIKYFYTDIPKADLKYDWPQESSLPEIPVPVSAISVTLNADDLSLMLDAVKQFCKDNPEFTDLLNQQIKAGLERSNPQLASQEGTDYVNEMIDGIKNSVQTDLKDTLITVKVDQDEFGSPVLITFGTQKPEGIVNSGVTIFFHNMTDADHSAIEVSIDSFTGGVINSQTRFLLVNSSDNANSQDLTVNIFHKDNKSTHLEYAQKTNKSIQNSSSHLSESDIQYYLNDNSGEGKIISTGTTNNFGGENTSAQITLTHSAMSKPVFEIVLSSESNTTEPLSGFTEKDAISAANMTESDYDQIAGNIFMQIMMLAMSMQ